MKYSVCNNAPLLKEFGLPSDIIEAKIHIKSKTKGDEKKFILSVEC